MTRNRPPEDVADELSRAISDAASSEGIEVVLTRSVGDGFGLVGSQVISVGVSTRPDPIVLWHEARNDFWIELGGGAPDAAWWSTGDDLPTLARVILAALAGNLDVRKGRVTVFLADRRPMLLAERL